MSHFRRIQAAFLWPKAIRQFEDRKLVECLNTLAQVRPYLGRTSSSVGVEADTIRIVSLGRLGRPEAVLEEIDPLLADITKLKNGYERAYLEAVVKVVGRYAAKAINRHDPTPPEKFEFDWTKVDLTHVPERLKYRFPLTGHPEWQRLGVQEKS